MNCRLDKSVCACLWPLVCKKWRLWLGAEGAAEPWDTHLWECRWLLYHTLSFAFDAQFIIFLLLDVLRVHQTQALFTESEITHFCWNACWMSVFVLFCRQHKINAIHFRAWFWINETEMDSEGTDQRVCRVNYMHDWTTPVWAFNIKCIWIYSISKNWNSLWSRMTRFLMVQYRIGM